MEKNNKLNFRILNLNASYEAPIYKYDKRNNLISWGLKNDYPAYLLGLYNNYGSALHKSIINKKTKLIAGRGFKDVISDELALFIKNNKLNHEIKKVALDYEIFNSFSLEIVYSNDGSINSVQHMPVHKLRLGIETEDIQYPYVWFSNDWSKYKKEGYEPELIKLYNKYVTTGKQIYLYNEYNPECDGTYSIPYYSASMNYIELAYEISKFHLNQAKQGYAPSFILNFATGIPTVDEMEEFYNEFQNQYSGTDNAGKIILTYSDGTDQKPELIPVQLNDSDERFISLNEQIQENIVMASEMPPQLVILTPGKLGSTEERRELMNEFQQAYITPRQEVIEDVMNEILSAFNEDLDLVEFVEVDNTNIINPQS